MPLRGFKRMCVWNFDITKSPPLEVLSVYLLVSMLASLSSNLNILCFIHLFSRLTIFLEGLLCGRSCPGVRGPVGAKGAG